MSTRLSKKYIDLDANDPDNGLSYLDIKEPDLTFSFDLDGTIKEVLYDDGRKVKFNYDKTTGRLMSEEVYAKDGITMIYKYVYTYSQETGDLISQKIIQY